MTGASHEASTQRRQARTAAINTWMLYFIQGCVLALIDETLNTLVGQVDLKYQTAITLCKLPFALKFFCAPFMDAARRLGSALRPWIIAAQAAATVCILWLWMSADATLASLGPGATSGAASPHAASFWMGIMLPLLGLALATAVADVGVDTFALENCPRYRSLLQVTGIMIGRVFSNPLFFYLGHHSLSFILLPMLAMSLALVGTLSFVVREQPVPQLRTPKRGGGSWLSQVLSESMVVLRDTLAFCLRRPLMFWWLLHQLIPPASYFHFEVMRTRFSTGDDSLSLENVAFWDLCFFPVAAVLIIAVDTYAYGKLKTFVKAYFVQALLCALIVLLYLGHTSGQLPFGNAVTELVYGVFMRVQDVLFFVFEVGEFNHYGSVAALQPNIASSLLALQASMFNIAEFVHPAIATNSVWMLSSDSFDAYPLVAAIGTVVGVGFFVLCWNRVAEYANTKHRDWEPKPRTLRANLALFVTLGSVVLYAAIVGIYASVQ